MLFFILVVIGCGVMFLLGKKVGAPKIQAYAEACEQIKHKDARIKILEDRVYKLRNPAPKKRRLWR